MADKVEISEGEEFVPLVPGAEFPKEAFKRSVVEDVPKGDVQHASSNGTITFQIASFAENIAPWGRVIARDRDLREFWKSEDMLKSAVYNLCVRNGAFEWEIEAPPETKIAVTNMLQNAIARTT